MWKLTNLAVFHKSCDDLLASDEIGWLVQISVTSVNNKHDLGHEIDIISSIGRRRSRLNAKIQQKF